MTIRKILDSLDCIYQKDHERVRANYHQVMYRLEDIINSEEYLDFLMDILDCQYLAYKMKWIIPEEDREFEVGICYALLLSQCLKSHKEMVDSLMTVDDLELEFI